MGSKAPLSINPEQPKGFIRGKVEGLIFQLEFWFFYDIFFSRDIVL